MTGTFAPSTTALIRPAPPRGIRTSMSPRAAIISAVVSWPPSTSWTASRGSPDASSPSPSAATTARFDCSADDEPRSSAALPDFKAMPPASAVTFGRAS
jgi:hypothetical protein